MLVCCSIGASSGVIGGVGDCISGVDTVDCWSIPSKKPLSINIGLSCNSCILSSAKFMMLTGLLVSQFWLKNSNASLFSWYPAAIVASIAFWSFSFTLIEFLPVPVAECWRFMFMHLCF